MNQRRIAQALRQLAAAIEAPDDDREDQEPPPVPDESQPVVISDLDRQRARRGLRRARAKV